MVETVDKYLLEKLCEKHGISVTLARKLIEEFSNVESTKKGYLKTVIEDEWDKYESQKDNP
jgi:hypothetical protein